MAMSKSLLDQFLAITMMMSPFRAGVVWVWGRAQLVPRPTPLENAIPRKSGGQAVGDHDQNKADRRLEQTNGGGQAVARRDQSGPIDVGIQDVAGAIDNRIVERQDLLESGLKHAAQVEAGDQNDDRADAGDVHVADALPPVGAIDG